MTSEHERRRHRRYPLRLGVKLHRGDEVVDADVVNASVSGCLLLTTMQLEAGETVEASIPALRVPPTRLVVVRSQVTASGWMVAVYFEQGLLDESSLAMLSGGDMITGPGSKMIN